MGFERVTQLCTKLAHDDTLKGVLAQAGVTDEEWRTLRQAVAAGADSSSLDSLLDRIDEAAARVGLEAVTSSIREFRPLPSGSVGYRSIEGWRCPHPSRCGRVEFGCSSAPSCGLTGKALDVVTVASG